MRPAGVLAVIAVALASVSLVQGGGWNQNAHLALARALSHGTPIVDDYAEATGDLARHDGNLYSAKAPGLALVTVAPYAALDRLGALGAVSRVTGVPRDDVDVWALAAIACGLAVAATLMLVWLLGDAIALGWGLAAAITLGVATLFLPFSTLLFAHVPAAALAFGAFAVLWHRPRPFVTAAAGVLAGLAMTVEYPLGIAAVALGVYAALTGDALRRGLAYAAGLVVGAAPLFLYNWWAFGSPAHFPYRDALPIYGNESNERGFFGISWPSPATAADLLVSERGLIAITPVVICGVAALVPLYRLGRRAEALLIAGLTLAFLVYNAGYDVPFGGDSPGPRFLVAILPFLAVPLALSYERWLWLTLALAVPSAVFAIGVTLTGPLQASGWDWLGDLPGHATVPETARFIPLVAIAVALTAAETLRRSRA